jgi:hypothetical protein
MKLWTIKCNRSKNVLWNYENRNNQMVPIEKSTLWKHNFCTIPLPICFHLPDLGSFPLYITLTYIKFHIYYIYKITYIKLHICYIYKITNILLHIYYIYKIAHQKYVRTDNNFHTLTDKTNWRKCSLGQKLAHKNMTIYDWSVDFWHFLWSLEFVNFPGDAKSH